MLQIRIRSDPDHFDESEGKFTPNLTQQYFSHKIKIVLFNITFFFFKKDGTVAGMNFGEVWPHKIGPSGSPKMIQIVIFWIVINIIRILYSKERTSVFSKMASFAGLRIPTQAFWTFPTGLKNHKKQGQSSSNFCT